VSCDYGVAMSHRKARFYLALLGISIVTSADLAGTRESEALESERVRVAQSPGAEPQTSVQSGMQTCIGNTARVVDTYRAINNEGPPSMEQRAPHRIRDVQLSDVITVEIKDLKTLLDERDCRIGTKPVVLFLNGHPIKGLTAYPPTDPQDGILKFVLRQTENSREAWTYILGKPESSRTVEVSVGFEDQYPIKALAAQPVLEFRVLPTAWLLLWVSLFLLMLAGFLWLAVSSNILRDGSPIAEPGKSKGTFSLAKSQGAWWFFIIIAAYLLIGITTGDFVTSINSTALILLGIGAGTVIGGAVIDASKNSPDAAAGQRAAAANALARATALETSISESEQALRAVTNPTVQVPILQQLADQRRELAEVRSNYRKLTAQSENFLTDILSDANGISFHRFQMAAWTLVLGIIFIEEMYQSLAMPTFDTTLMGLLGLSAGTYLGLKIPEPTVPSSR
jgi:hypothetical protein